MQSKPTLNHLHSCFPKERLLIANLIQENSHLHEYVFTDPGAPEWQDGVPDEKECNVCANVHSVLVQLFEVVPM